MAYIIDIEGSSGSEDANGLQITRKGEGTPDAAHTASDIGIKMLEELNADNLGLGDPHPDFPGILVWNRPFVPSGDIVRFDIQYRPFPLQSAFQVPAPPPDNVQPATKSLEFAQRRKKRTTHFDPVNLEIENWVQAPPKFATAEQQLIEIDVNKGIGVLTFQREEKDNPTAALRLFKDTINAAAEGPYAAETLLFRPVRAVTQNDGESWSVTYQFHWDEDGHGVEIVWLTGANKPAEQNDANSRKIVVPYKRANWSVLNLDFND